MLTPNFNGTQERLLATKKDHSRPSHKCIYLSLYRLWFVFPRLPVPSIISSHAHIHHNNFMFHKSPSLCLMNNRFSPPPPPFPYGLAPFTNGLTINLVISSSCPRIHCSKSLTDDAMPPLHFCASSLHFHAPSYTFVSFVLHSRTLLLYFFHHYSHHDSSPLLHFGCFKACWSYMAINWTKMFLLKCTYDCPVNIHVAKKLYMLYKVLYMYYARYYMLISILSPFRCEPFDCFQAQLLL